MGRRQKFRSFFRSVENAIHFAQFHCRGQFVTISCNPTATIRNLVYSVHRGWPQLPAVDCRLPSHHLWLPRYLLIYRPLSTISMLSRWLHPRRRVRPPMHLRVSRIRLLVPCTFAFLYPCMYECTCTFVHHRQSQNSTTCVCALRHRHHCSWLHLINSRVKLTICNEFSQCNVSIWKKSSYLRFTRICSRVRGCVGNVRLEHHSRAESGIHSLMVKKIMYWFEASILVHSWGICFYRKALPIPFFTLDVQASLSFENIIRSLWRNKD